MTVSSFRRGLASTMAASAMLLQGSNRMTVALAEALDLLFDGGALGRRVLASASCRAFATACAVAAVAAAIEASASS